MKQPNVVLIISDQWSKSIADGSGENKNGVFTPGIDELAKEGVRFENNYSSYPLCCPARSSMFTGCMPHETHIIDNQEIQKQKGFFRPNEELKTLGETLKEHGYDTAYFGKEHAAGFGYKGMDELGTLLFSGGGCLAEGSLYDQIFTNDSIRYLNQKHEKPFYMVLSLINPHDMCKALGGPVADATIADAAQFCRTDDELYLRGQMRAGLPENFDSKFEKGMIPDKDWMFKDLAKMDEDHWKRNISTYDLLIEKTDLYVQRVNNELKRLGLEDNTIVIFTTDHGDMMGGHGIIGKTNMYEESSATHLIIKYKDVIKPLTVNKNALSNTIDLMPTILDLCGIEIPNTVKGQSLKEECMGINTHKFEETYSENSYSRMLRYKNYKYVISNIYGERYDILFDLEKDPLETTNIYNQEGYEEISKEVNQKLEAYLEREGISTHFDLQHPFYLDK